MTWWGVGIGAASLLVTSVGTGLSYFGQQQQASNAEAIANYNAQIAAQNNQINQIIAKQQADYQRRYAEIQATAQRQNADVLNAQGRAAEAAGREEARRQRERNEKAQAMQRARYAKAGVTTEGSPLAVMSESAALLELQAQDIHHKSELEGRAFDEQAKAARYQAQMSDFDASVARYQMAAADAGFTIGSNQANANYLAGMSAASGYQTASYGTLISGAGSAMSIGADSYDRIQTNQLYKTSKTPKVR